MLYPNDLVVIYTGKAVPVNFGEVRQVLSGNAAKLPALDAARRHGLSPKENLRCSPKAAAAEGVAQCAYPSSAAGYDCDDLES